LIGQFGVGFYSAFMVAEKVDVISRRAGQDQAAMWSSDGLGTYTIGPVEADQAPARGTRIVLHLLEDAADYAQAPRIEQMVRAQSGHAGADHGEGQAGRRWHQVADGTALWTRPRARSRPRNTGFLPQRGRAVGRSGADPALPRRGAARIFGAGLRARKRPSTCSIPIARAA
jgi:molecular chaperone HtpG